MTYDTSGTKRAIVTVSSQGGQTVAQSCGNSVVVRNPSANNGGGNTINNTTNNQTDNNGLSASALFSLKNVPWGWVGILVILILIATIIYLTFNRKKI
jgi:hypothetical protein